MPFLRFRHRARLGLALAIVLAGGSALSAAAPCEMPRAVTGEEKASSFIGLWELDLTRMPDTYGPPPKRVTFLFEDLGGGEWRTTIDITAPDDSVRHATVSYRRDGRAVTAGEGNIGEADAGAFYSPAPDVLVMNLAKNRTSAGVRVYTLSADGREMTESAAGIDAEGTPFVRAFHFRRVR